MEIVDKALHYVTHYKLSDVHLHVNEPVAIRVDGDIQTFDDDIVTQLDFDSFIKNWLTQDQRIKFMESFDADLAVESGEYRFRVNLFKTARGLAAVMRKIETQIPTFDSLGLPAVARDVIEQENGLILVTGPTGSGKSTTLAAMIDRINRHRPGHIITIEDPIEFVHRSQKSVISQREVARDTLSFASALRASLREDPDVILVGELRDLETIRLALTAAETGHLVLASLHTRSAAASVERIVDVFDAHEKALVRTQLSEALVGVVTQTLCVTPTSTEGSLHSARRAVFETLVATPAIRHLIREGKTAQIQSAMQTGAAHGMQTMAQAMREAGLVT